MAFYDKADWQSGGPHPEDLPSENKGTHIGMFLAWAIRENLVSELHLQKFHDSILAVKERRMTGREFLALHCDNALQESDLSEEGNRFARAYYTRGNRAGYGLYIADYEKSLTRRLPSFYLVTDTWENSAWISTLITKRFLKWKEKDRRHRQTVDFWLRPLRALLRFFHAPDSR
jgi:hypothetical protein